MKIIEFKGVSFSYDRLQTDEVAAIQDLSLEIEKGSHTAILGRNGSGKSTIARLMNALELPQQGKVIVNNLDTSDEENLWEIRRICGMVFQNPDNQIIGTTVEEDVAFGPENLGFPREKIRKVVDDALAAVGLSEMAERQPANLSGGQKQKVAIAGVLAIQPDCIILDEATAMLDPRSAAEVMQLVERLRQERNITVINITHNMEEVLLADQVYVLQDGHLVKQGTPAEIFDQVELIKKLGLDIPIHTEIAWDLANLVHENLIPLETSEWDGAIQATLRIAKHIFGHQAAEAVQYAEVLQARKDHNQRKEARTLLYQKDPIIQIKDLQYTYAAKTTFQTEALKNINLDIYRGELLGIIGESGSGKSTLIQHLNGLIKPQAGEVRVLGLSTKINEDIRKMRQEVGLLFQYPEHQLFEETVYKDIAFGPTKMGLDEAMIKKQVEWAAELVGLPPEIMLRSPFEISGGQKRRVAIAGILAMKPSILVLDEPAAGLDPVGRKEIFSYAAKLKKEGVTVILVSHNMEDIAKLADRIVVMHQGEIALCDRTSNVFRDEEMIVKIGLSVPKPVLFLKTLKKQYPLIEEHLYTPINVAREIIFSVINQEHTRDGGLFL